MPSVQEYLTEAFPSVIADFSEWDMRELDGMPIESTCGEACKTAIDRGKSLDDLIRDGHGPYYDAHRAETKAIAQTVIDLCNLYICG